MHEGAFMNVLCTNKFIFGMVDAVHIICIFGVFHRFDLRVETWPAPCDIYVLNAELM